MTAVSGSTGTFVTSDGTELLTRSWIPAHIKGHIVIVHGYGEHCGRYGHVADRLNAEGYAVYSYDQRGHGRSPGKMGRIENFDRLVEDANEFIQKIFAGIDAAPKFIFGHSMGGLVVSACVLRHPPDARGLILTNPGVKADENTAPLLRKVAKWAAMLLPGMKAHELDINGLSRIQRVVDEYAADPLVHHGFIDARTGYEMVRTIEFVQANLNKLTLPFITLHGTADRLVSYHAAEMLFEKASSRDKTLKLYDGGYHELFNDQGADRFFADLLDWLKAHS